jgi:stress response protein YsnF/uncharacterized membrane protein
MAKTVTALFETYTDAHNAMQDLVDHGFQRDDISIMAHESLAERDRRLHDDDTPGAVTGGGVGAAVGGVGGLLLGLTALAVPGVGPVLAIGPLVTALAGAGIGAAAGALIGALTDLGVPEEEAHYYAEGIRRGGVLVVVETTDDLAEQAVSILNRHNPLDLDRHIGEWRQSGWSRFDDTATPFLSAHAPERLRTHDEVSGMRRTATTAPVQPPGKGQPVSTTHSTAKETVIPVVEEDLQVSKRQTERDVQVRTTVAETPVEEQVRLRQEHVTVERRPVDRPAHVSEAEAFKETTMTVTETAEEPVVSKKARVVEEVIIHKDVAEHTETVRDTVRRTEVVVEHPDTVRQADRQGFETYDPDFRVHYGTTFATRSGATYEHYVPAYQYGYTMATDQRYRDRDWIVVEPEVRRTWEERHAGTWEQFKDAIRYSWDKVRGRR